eukprot:4879539-Prymnesium_polylepis.1
MARPWAASSRRQQSRALPRARRAATSTKGSSRATDCLDWHREAKARASAARRLDDHDSGDQTLLPTAFGTGGGQHGAAWQEVLPCSVHHVHAALRGALSVAVDHPLARNGHRALLLV